MSPAINTPETIDSTDTTALIIEIVFGLFGILGVGWLYVGNFAAAVLVFLGFGVLVVAETIAVFFTLGFAACLVVPVNIAVAIISGIRVRDHVRRTGATGSLANLLFVIVGIVVIVAAIVSIAFLFALTPAFLE